MILLSLIGVVYIGFVALARTLFTRYPKRSILGATLMITQSLLYNAIFFTYGLVLEFFFHVKATETRSLAEEARSDE